MNEIILDGVELAVGMHVWSLRHGWLVVQNLNPNDPYPIVCCPEDWRRHTYTFMPDGRWDRSDKYRTLFLNEIDLTPPPPLKRMVKKWQWVCRSDKGHFWLATDPQSEFGIVEHCKQPHIRSMPIQRIDSTMIEEEE